MKIAVSLGLAGVLGISLPGCSASSQPRFVEPPSVSANPNSAVPLAAVVRFAADRKVHTTLQVSDGEHQWKLDYDESRNPKDGLPVIGMRPDRRHEIRVSIQDKDGETVAFAEALSFTTPPLPTDLSEFPPIRITVSRPERMEPGFTLFSPRRRRIGDARYGAGFGMLLAVDARGEVVWYYRTDSRISDLETLANGNIAFITQDYRVVEIDLLGNVVKTWYASRRPQGPAEAVPIDTLAVHHEVDELPSGNLVVLGVEMREIDNYYTSEDDARAPRKRQKVMGDEIIEFQRDGKEVWRWKAFENMDPFRIGYETFSSYWSRRGFPDTVDWSHANGLMYNEYDDSLLVCFRYQAAVLKIDRKSGQVRWVLGEPTGWPDNLRDKVLKLENGDRWFYHQHAPHPTPNGTLLLFDNGNYRTRPFTPPLPPAQTYSRAVEYAIDETNRTAREVWTSEGPGPESVVSFAMGDVDWMPQSGNILVHYGAIVPRPDIAKFNWQNALQLNQWTRIREYTHTTPAEVVWELILGDPSGVGTDGWLLFGGDRLPRLGFVRE